MPQGARTVSRDVCTLSNSLQTFTLQHLKIIILHVNMQLWKLNSWFESRILRNLYSSNVRDDVQLLNGWWTQEWFGQASYITTYTGSCACWVWLFSLVISIPLTGSEWVSRHFRFRFDGGGSGGLPIYFRTQFAIAVTTALACRLGQAL